MNTTSQAENKYNIYLKCPTENQLIDNVVKENAYTDLLSKRQF